MPAKSGGTPLHVWEAEVMVRAAAWILIWRGTGFALGCALGDLALIPLPGETPFSWQAWAIPALLQAIAGLAVLCRDRRARWAALPIVIVWCYWTASPVLAMIHLPVAPRHAFGLSGPLMHALRPAFFLPDTYALYCLFRRHGGEALTQGLPPLPALATAWRVRATGRVVLALGMTTLAILSAAMCLVFLPGAMIS